MGLPNISIKFQNGKLGTVPVSQDGLLALVCAGVVVSSTFVLDTPYTIYRLSGLEELGVKADTEGNERIHALVKQFYTEAPEGTPLVVFAVNPATTMTELCDKDSGKLRDLLQSQDGKLRGIIVARNPSPDEPTTSEGIDADVLTAVPKAQALAEWATSDLYAPIFVALEGRAFKSSSSLKDLTKEENNRVCIVLGNDEQPSNNVAVGLFAGRVAKSPVQRNIGRVRDGALKSTSALYLGTKEIGSAMDDVNTIYGKGYITPRTYVGLSGYYYTDDCMCTKVTDDYSHLTARRVIDKAYRIAYNSLLNNMLDELQVNADGTLQYAVIKSWQAQVEKAINMSMTANGELASGDGKNGCICYIDPKQNVLATSTIIISLSVRPFGYARNINVELGFQVEAK